MNAIIHHLKSVWQISEKTADVWGDNTVQMPRSIKDVIWSVLASLSAPRYLQRFEQPLQHIRDGWLFQILRVRSYG